MLRCVSAADAHSIECWVSVLIQNLVVAHRDRAAGARRMSASDQSRIRSHCLDSTEPGGEFV